MTDPSACGDRSGAGCLLGRGPALPSQEHGSRLHPDPQSVQGKRGFFQHVPAEFSSLDSEFLDGQLGRKPYSAGGAGGLRGSAGCLLAGSAPIPTALSQVDGLLRSQDLGEWLPSARRTQTGPWESTESRTTQARARMLGFAGGQRPAGGGSQDAALAPGAEEGPGGPCLP